MIEQGFLMLVQSRIGAALPNVVGYGLQLPKDCISPSNPQAWAYYGVASKPTYVLEGQDPFTEWDVRVDCHGYTMQDAVSLARAISSALSGGRGATLQDSDSTVVVGILDQGSNVDGFSDSNRSYVRTLEYTIQYYEQ